MCHPLPKIAGVLIDHPLPKISALRPFFQPVFILNLCCRTGTFCGAAKVHSFRAFPPVLSQIGDKQVNVRTYTAAFNLRGAAQEKLVGTMSGGERNRVHLAKVIGRVPL